MLWSLWNIHSQSQIVNPFGASRQRDAFLPLVHNWISKRDPMNVFYVVCFVFFSLSRWNKPFSLVMAWALRPDNMLFFRMHPFVRQVILISIVYIHIYAHGQVNGEFVSSVAALNQLAANDNGNSGKWTECAQCVRARSTPHKHQTSSQFMWNL